MPIYLIFHLISFFQHDHRRGRSSGNSKKINKSGPLFQQEESLATEGEAESDAENIFEDSMAFECRQDANSAPMFAVSRKQLFKTSILFQEKKKARCKKRKVPNSPLIEPAGKRLSDEHAKKAGISKLPRVRKTSISTEFNRFFQPALGEKN